METRLSRICDALIEAGWLVALIVTPLFFNTYSSRVFEPDKLHLLRSIAVLVAVIWIVQLLDSGWHRAGQPGPTLWSRIRSTPLVLPALLLVVCYLISTAFSVVPSISFLGSYVRLQGTFTFMSYVVLFVMVLTHLRTRAQINRLTFAIILTSLPISLYGLLQHYGLDPLPWGGDVQQRVAANMGNAIFVAAYLIMAFFLTTERLIDGVAAIVKEDRLSDVLRVVGYAFVAIAQVITIVFTESRGPQIGWLVGVYVFGMVGLRLLGNWADAGTLALAWLRQATRSIFLGFLALAIVAVAFFGVLNVPQGPLAKVCKERYIGRMCSLFSLNEGSNAVRVLIWEGAVDMMFEPHTPIQWPAGTPTPWWVSSNGTTPTDDTLNPVRLLIGYGPESMWVAYNRFYPPDLAHYEARNASPDRSHNETFDAVVRTGLLGLVVQMSVFLSIFYFALRWLGLMQDNGRRLLFWSFLAAGAVLGVVVPLAFDHSLRLMGIVLPAGLILGLILYVTIDLLLPAATAPAAEARYDLMSGSFEPLGGAPANGTTAAQAVRSGHQQLLVLALFATVVAHYVEIHTGIAIASTLTHFWILSGVLVVVGMGWVRDAEAPAPAATAAAPEAAGRVTSVAAAPAAGNSRATQTRGHGPKTEATRVQGRALRAQARAPRGQQESRGTGANRQFYARPAKLSSWQVFLPYALIAAVITLVLVWDYVLNQTGSQGALKILMQAFTTRVVGSARTPTGSPWLALLVLITWAVGGGLALAEAYRERAWQSGEYRWGPNATLYACAVLGTFFIYGLFEAGQTQIAGLPGMTVFDHIARYLTAFDAILLLMGLALAMVVSWTDIRPRPLRWLGNLPVLPITGGIVLTVLGLIVIFAYNITPVQADMYYKQGQAYEDAGQWDGAIVLYQKAAQMEPREDYYYLFLGRALLEYASTAKAGPATLPMDVSGIATPDLLNVAQSGVTSGTREDISRAAYAILIGAQRLNPLNTDHTANLARLFRTWAFSNSPAAANATNNSLLRDTVRAHPDQVNMGELNESLDYYESATSLSPNNAQLWNEQASVRFIQGNTQGALADLERSAGLDERFEQTFLLQGDMLADAGDKKGALDAYNKALALNPNDTSVLSAAAVYSAQTGNVPAALVDFNKLIGMEKPPYDSVYQRLSALQAQATQAGGFDKLGGSATAQQQSLQSNLESRRSQLEAAYRNEALVLRDAGQADEALTAAQSALALASSSEKPEVQQLVAELQTTGKK